MRFCILIDRTYFQLILNDFSMEIDEKSASDSNSLRY